MTDLQQTLRDLRAELGRAERLSEEDRALLETVLSDIHRVLEAPVSHAAPWSTATRSKERRCGSRPGIRGSRARCVPCSTPWARPASEPRCNINDPTQESSVRR